MGDWLSLADVVSATGMEGLSERPVARVGGVIRTRGQFIAEVLGWRAAFARVEGARVALHFEDTYAFVCALYGAWHAGKSVALPGDTQADTLARLLPDMAACAGDLPGAVGPIANDATRPSSLAPLDLLSTRVVVHTSGSSGEPLAIDKSLAQLDAEVRTLERAFGPLLASRGVAQGPVRVHATVSHQHIYGLLFHALWPLAAGRSLVAERLRYPEDIAARLADAPGVLVTSPAHLKRLPESLSWQAARDRLVAVFSSGGPLPPEASEAALSLLGQSPIEVFGSSETGGIAWRQRALHADHWTALPGVRWRVDADGLLAVQSAHLPDDDWYVTADRAEADADGGFLLRGRADRIVKIEEKRVSLTAMEHALLCSGLLVEARVVELPEGSSSRLGLVAVPNDAGRAVLAEGKRALNDRLRAVLLQSVERVALPRRFRFVDRLPANAQGKTPLAALQALFRPRRPEAQWVSRDAERAVARLDVAADLLVFDGHFPGTPVLPGVAQVDWAVRYAAECFPLPARMLRLDALKFQRPVRPGTSLELSLHWRAADRVLGFVYTSDAGTHAGGSVVFRPDGHD
jgi:acyl-CoA synthetase (AMP-forming)/AMP-acid ligase II